MSSLPEQLTFYSQPEKSQSNEDSFQFLRRSFIGSQKNSENKPAYDPDYSLPDESDPNTFPENPTLKLREDLIDTVIRYYETSIHNHPDDNQKSRDTKRANLAYYRSLQYPNNQAAFFEELTSASKTEFDQLAEDYANSNSEDARKKIRQAARKIMQNYFAAQQQLNYRDQEL